METTQNATNAMAAISSKYSDISTIILQMIERAHRLGIKFQLPALLGYLYWKAAGSDADMQVVQILEADTLDTSFFNEKEIYALTTRGDQVVDFVLRERRANSKETSALPQELSQLIMKNLLHLYVNGTIYLPYAGVASFAEALPGATYVGEEINPTFWALGKVCAFFKHLHLNIERGDSSVKEEKYDTIVTMPPFMFRGDANLASILESLFNRLNDGGQMAVVVPAGFLFDVRKEYHRVKKLLLEQHALYRVVLLPPSLLSNTNTSFAVLLIQRGGNADKVILTDYSEFVKDNRKHGSIYKLDIEAIEDAERTQIMRTLSDAHKDSFVVDEEAESKARFEIRVETADLLQAEGIDLNPKYHLNRAKLLKEVPEGMSIMPLHKVAEIYGRVNMVGGAKRPTIRVQDLSDSILDGPKDFSGLEIDERRGIFPLLMEDHLLLVALVGKSLKPTIYKHREGSQTAYSENVVPLKVVSPLVSVEYLQCELASNYVQEQLDANHVGSFRPFISRANLKNLLIRVPSRPEQQQKIVDAEKEALSAALIQKLGIENEELRNARYNEFVREMRVRKHAIGQVLNELDPAIDTLLRFENSKNGVLRGSDIISERFGYSVDDYLQRVRFLVTKVMTMVNSLTNEYAPKSEIKEYNVVQLLEEYFQNHSIANGYEVSIKHETFNSDLHVPAGIELPDGSITEEINISAGDNMDFWTIEVCKEDFFQVLDNIISNAKRYGFTENRPDYAIRIEMENVRNDKQPMVAIHIMNNGNPLPKGVSPEQVFLYGEGSAQGTGIGGWQIKQIVEGMGGSVELRTYEEKEADYSIDYVLTFPDKSVVVLDDNNE